jgi:uncharacterized Zn finger protein
MKGYVRCSCGSQDVVGKSHLGIKSGRTSWVTYTCQECGHVEKVTQSSGQLELKQIDGETDLDRYYREKDEEQ